MNAAAKVHPFEARGLGSAPFRCIGVERRVGPIRTIVGGVTCEVGAPGQPMGTCAYCGTGIADCYAVKSSDGKEFVVGCDCVRRVSAEFDGTIPPDFRRAIAKLEREKRDEKRVEKEAKVAARVVVVREILSANPNLLKDEQHPSPWRATQGETLRDYAEWVLSNAGASGRDAICKMVEQAAAKVTP